MDGTHRTAEQQKGKQTNGQTDDAIFVSSSSSLALIL